MIRIIHYSKLNGEEGVYFTEDLTSSADVFIGANNELVSDEQYPIQVPVGFPLDKEMEG